MSQQQGESAAEQGPIISLLNDLMILSYRDQIASYKNKDLAFTTVDRYEKSLCPNSCMGGISEILNAKSPSERL